MTGVPRSGGRLTRVAVLVLLGGLILTIELILRGNGDLRTQIVGQCVAFALFIPAAWLCWRGLGVGRAGVVIVVLFAIAFRAAAFDPGGAPPLSTDLYRYAWDARVTASGINPYREPPGDARLAPLRDPDVWRNVNRKSWRTPYPPGAEGAFLAARGVFGHGARATTWLLLLCEVGTVTLLGVVLTRSGAPLERVALYAWHPLAVSEIAANGHTDALAVVALAGLLAAWQARRFTAAGVAVALAALVKIGPALLLPALARRGRLRFVAAAFATAALAYLPFLSVGTRVLGSARQLLHRDEFGSIESLMRPHISQGAALDLLGAVLVAVIAVVAVRDHVTIDQMARSCLLVLGTILLTSTLVQPWYALWLLPFLAIVAAPGWLWLTGSLPLLYLNGIQDPLPAWVLPAIYGPFAAWALWRILGRRPSRRRVALAPLATPPRVVAILLALNEEEALPGLLAEVRSAPVERVIVVDGGSTDRTGAIARDSGADVINEPRRGYGRACAAGAAAAQDADIVVFLDGDGSDDPAELERVIEPVAAGRAALALGARRDLEPGALLVHQRIGNALVAFMVRRIYGVSIHDVPPMRAIRRDVLDQLAMGEMTYGWPTEMIVKAARAGLPLEEVAVRSRRRRGGVSKVAGRAIPSALAGVRMLAVVARHV